jgi:hypothetical protein
MYIGGGGGGGEATATPSRVPAAKPPMMPVVTAPPSRAWAGGAETANVIAPSLLFCFVPLGHLRLP